MTDIIIENIVASSKIAEELDIEQLSKNIIDSNYNPEEFNGLTVKFEDPKVAVLILSNGKVICTGAKDIKDINTSLEKISKKLKDAGVILIKKQDVEIQNIIVSADLKKHLHLASIAKGLLLEKASYTPNQFPGLIYKIQDSNCVVILFGSGKVVCTGANNLEEATKSVEMMKEKLSSLGVL